jgi:hypothetical protein
MEPWLRLAPYNGALTLWSSHPLFAADSGPMTGNPEVIPRWGLPTSGNWVTALHYAVLRVLSLPVLSGRGIDDAGDAGYYCMDFDTEMGRLSTCLRPHPLVA